MPSVLVRTALSTLTHKWERPYIQVSDVQVTWLAEGSSCVKIVFGDVWCRLS